MMKNRLLGLALGVLALAVSAEWLFAGTALAQEAAAP